MKRFTDTEKWKKPFIRELKSAYKLLWLYILDECDHAGIWQKEIEVAEIRIGEKIDWNLASELFKEKIIELNNGSKWFIPDFIKFQYGELKIENRAHQSVINILTKNKIDHKGLISSFQGAKDMDMDKDKDKDKERQPKKNVYTDIFNTFFDSYHKITRLPEKDKESAYITWKSLSDNERISAMANIKPYYDSVKDKKFLKWCKNYLSAKCFNDKFEEEDPLAGLPDYMKPK